MKKYRRMKMETLMGRLEEYRQTPKGANDNEAGWLLDAVKKYLDQKAQGKAGNKMTIKRAVIIKPAKEPPQVRD